jgi:hypothetical protein
VIDKAVDMVARTRWGCGCSYCSLGPRTVVEVVVEAFGTDRGME